METCENGQEKKYARVFKSYYVVWKPDDTTIWNTFSTGLNRTMQYGNFNFEIFYKYDCESLNRTMQYGNIYDVSVNVPMTTV